MANLARTEAAKLTGSLRKGILAETQLPVKKTNLQLDRFGGIGDELTDRLDLGNNLLKGLL